LVSADPATHERLVRALEPVVDVEIVASGAATLELVLVDRSIELVLCPARMADLSACQFLHNLRWIVPGKRPPVFVLGETDAKEITKALELGAVKCIAPRASARSIAGQIEEFVYRTAVAKRA
jgi:CheY-like chemotaxis protein